MLGLKPARFTRWDAVSAALTLLGFATALTELPSRQFIAVGFIVIALIVFLLRTLGHEHADPAKLIVLKDEGTTILNTNPMDMLKRGDAKDENFAVAVWGMNAHLWFEETLAELKRAGVSDGDRSDFTTLITFQPLPSPLQGEDGNHHSHRLGMLAERLHRLRAIIAKLESS